MYREVPQESTGFSQFQLLYLYGHSVRGPATILKSYVDSCVGARIKLGSKTKAYHLNMLKKYIATGAEVEVVHTSNKNDATIAVAGVIYQDTDPELGEVPDLEGYH